MASVLNSAFLEKLGFLVKTIIFVSLLSLLSACSGGGSGGSSGETLPPQPAPTGIKATIGIDHISLEWTNPDNKDFTGVTLVRSAGDFAADIASGTMLYSGTAESFTDTGLAPGAYYYSLYSTDIRERVSEPAQVALTVSELPLTNVSDVQVTIEDGDISITWSDPAEAGFSATVIRHSTSMAPATISDGDEVYSGADETYEASGLVPGIHYYALFCSYDDGSYSKPQSLAVVVLDTSAPAAVASVAALSTGVGETTLSWVNPVDADFAGVVIRRDMSEYPLTPFDGIEVYSGIGNSHIDTGVAGTFYYYSLFAMDGSGNYSTAALVRDSAPDKVSSLGASLEGDTITLNWLNPGDLDFSGVTVRRGASGFPAGPGDGLEVYRGSAQTTSDAGLSEGIYYYSVFAFDNGDNYSLGRYVAVNVVKDIFGQVSGLHVSIYGDNTTLSWTNPVDPDFAGVMIRNSDKAFPATALEGVEAYNGSTETFTDSGLSLGNHYYSIFAYNNLKEYSEPLQVAVVIIDTTPPAPVTLLTASSLAENEVALGWVNPTDADFAGVMIRRSQVGYPLTHEEGVEIYSGRDQAFTDAVSYGAAYYYSVFSYDDKVPPNISGPAIASAVSIDTIGPQVVSRIPDNGATGVPAGDSLVVAFNEPLDPASVTGANIQIGQYYYDPYYGTSFYAVGGTATYDEQTYTATYTPSIALPYSTELTARVTTGITDNSANKNPLPALEEWTFTTEPDTYGPTVSTTIPEDASLNVGVQTNINIHFDENIDSTTVDETTVLVAGTAANIYAGSNYIIIGTDTGWLPYDQTISVTLTTGITDLAGNPMLSEYTMSFTTEVDAAPPQLVTANLVDGQKLISTNPTFTLEFSEPMDAATIDSTTLVLTQGITPIAGTISYDIGSFTASLTPDSPLDYDTDYQLTLGSTIADAQGLTLGADQTFGFRTAGPTEQINGFSSSLHNNAVIEFNDSGQGLALWNVASGSGYNLVYSYNDGAGWSVEQSLVSGSGSIYIQPTLLSDGAGFMLNWVDDNRHLHANYFVGGAWSGDVVLDTQTYQRTAKMVTDGSGFAAAWLSGPSNTSSAHSVMASVYDGVDWVTSEIASTPSGTLPFDLAASRGIDPYCVVFSTDSYMNAKVYDGSAWNSWLIYSNTNSYDHIRDPAVVGSDTGFAATVSDWFSGSTFSDVTLYASVYNGASWSSVTQLTSSYNNSSIDYQLLSNGADYMVVFKSSGYTTVWHYRLIAKSLSATGTVGPNDIITDMPSSIGAYEAVSNGSGYAVAWRYSSSAYVSTYDAAWISPVELSANVSGGGYGGAPFLIGSSGGNYAVLWNDLTAAQPYVAFSTNWVNAQRISSALETNPFRNAAIGENEATGHFSIVWSQSGGMNLRSTYLLGGEHVLNPQLNLSTGNYPGAVYTKPAVASRGDATVAVWVQYDEGIRGVYANARHAGAWGTPVKLSKEGIECINPSVACSATSCVATWMSENEIKTRRYDQATKLWDGGDPVSAYTPTLNQAYDPSIASNGTGYMLAFNFGGIQVVSSADGVAWSGPTALSSNWGEPMMISNGGGYLAAYADSPSMTDYLRAKVYTSGAWSTNYENFSQINGLSLVALASNGSSYMVAWTMNSRIQAKECSAAGVWGAQVEISGYAYLYAVPRLVADGTDYVALWNQYSWGAYTSRYVSATSTWDPEFRLSDGIAGPMANVNGHFLTITAQSGGLYGGYFNGANDSADSAGFLDFSADVQDVYNMNAATDSSGFAAFFIVNNMGTSELWSISAK